MNTQNKFSKPVIFAEELKKQNVALAKKYYKLQNETNKKQENKQNTQNSELNLKNQFQKNYKKNFEKW